MEEPPQNPYEPPQAPPKEREEPNPYWGRPSLLNRFLYLDLVGKLRLWGMVLLLLNVVCLPFGFWIPWTLALGLVLLLVSWLVGNTGD
jgi:hypothetical protein